MLDGPNERASVGKTKGWESYIPIYKLGYVVDSIVNYQDFDTAS